ncbi:MAG: hypothetical protein JO272_13310 [Pseudonocardiales bacterium]|nr:hypothetical protein [Pseudonocardiales bacterium]
MPTRLRVQFGNYVDLFKDRNTAYFVIAAFVGRFPTSMRAVNLIVFFSEYRKSYTLGSIVLAVYSVCSAIGSPVLGRLVDRLGERTVVLPAALLHIMAMSGLIVLTISGAGSSIVALCSATAGVSGPRLPLLVRVRWAHHLGDRNKIVRAYALEGALDEAAWILGPAVASFTVSGLGAESSMWISVICVVVGTAAFLLAGQSNSIILTRGRVRFDAKREVPTKNLVLWHLIGVFAMIGVTLGSVDVGLIITAIKIEKVWFAGSYLTCFALGSMLSVFAFGAVTKSRSAARTFRCLGVSLVPVTATLLFVPGGTPMAAASALVGAVITPFMSIGYTLTEQVSNSGRKAESLSWAAGAVGLGIAAGSWLAGSVSENLGAHNALVIPLCSCFVTLILIMVGLRCDHREIWKPRRSRRGHGGVSMTGTVPAWTVAAAACSLGWTSVEAQPLSGSDASQPVVRVRRGSETAVLKRYEPDVFGVARLIAGLPDAPFAPLLGESPHHLVLAFTDLGSDSFSQHISSDPSGRRQAAMYYVKALLHAQSALSALGKPPPVPPATSLNSFIGFDALTRVARSEETPARQLAAIAGNTRVQPPPASVVRAAKEADHKLASELASHQAHRRWILQDSNPSNLILAPDGRPRWVDVLAIPGLPETNLLTLPGAHFRLDEGEMLEVVRNTRWRIEPELLRTLNGLYSIFTLCDTCLGLVDGSRDGLVHSGMSYQESEAFSLSLASEYLASGIAPATGYLPFVEWLTTSDSLPPGTPARQ